MFEATPKGWRSKGAWCRSSMRALASAKRIKLSMCRAVIGAPPVELLVSQVRTRPGRCVNISYIYIKNLR